MFRVFYFWLEKGRQCQKGFLLLSYPFPSPLAIEEEAFPGVFCLLLLASPLLSQYIREATRKPREFTTMLVLKSQGPRKPIFFHFSKCYYVYLLYHMRVFQFSEGDPSRNGVTPSWSIRRPIILFNNIDLQLQYPKVQNVPFTAYMVLVGKQKAYFSIPHP